MLKLLPAKSDAAKSDKVIGRAFLGYYLKRGRMVSSRAVIVGDQAIVYASGRRTASVMPAKLVFDSQQAFRRGMPGDVAYIASHDGKLLELKHQKDANLYVSVETGVKYSPHAVHKTKKAALRAVLRALQQTQNQVRRSERNVKRNIAARERKIGAIKRKIARL